MNQYDICEILDYVLTVDWMKFRFISRDMNEILKTKKVDINTVMYEFLVNKRSRLSREKFELVPFSKYISVTDERTNFKWEAISKLIIDNKWLETIPTVCCDWIPSLFVRLIVCFSDDWVEGLQLIFQLCKGLPTYTSQSWNETYNIYTLICFTHFKKETGNTPPKEWMFKPLRSIASDRNCKKIYRFLFN